MSRKKTELLIIDPQNDFCDPKGALPVAGADADGVRLADFIKRNLYAIDDIHVTLDSHRLLDVAHPMFWIDKQGKNPNPFTLISNDDIKNGVWKPFNPNLKCPPYGTLTDRMLHYTKKLGDNAKYVLCIWPPHCRIGTWGHNVFPVIMNAFDEWETKRFGIIDYVTKGTNMFTEHYSAVLADVPDPEDPTTLLNSNLISTLESCDLLIISGQALSHCVRHTVFDIASSFGVDSIKKMLLLEDTSSSVPGFESLGDEFVNEMVKRGMQIGRADSLVL